MPNPERTSHMIELDDETHFDLDEVSKFVEQE